MEKRIIIVIVALVALVSCTKPFVPKETNYYVDDKGSFLFTASVETLSGNWIWDAARSKVGIYTPGASNVAFLPRAAYDGLSGAAQLMGPPVEGQAFAYLPWSKNGNDAAAHGCQLLPSIQRYYPEALTHIENNTPVLAAAADESGNIIFRNLCGALHLRISIQFHENVQRVVLSANEPLCGWLSVTGGGFVNPATSVSVEEIDRPCSVSAPLDVWVMLPEGTYTGLYLTVAGATESISTVLDGSATVSAREESPGATVQEKKNSYDGSDFEGEEVDYD